jgi:hypothetical protein
VAIAANLSPDVAPTWILDRIDHLLPCKVCEDWQMTRIAMQTAGVMASVLTVPLTDDGLIAPCRRRRSGAHQPRSARTMWRR